MNQIDRITLKRPTLNSNMDEITGTFTQQSGDNVHQHEILNDQTYAATRDAAIRVARRQGDDVIIVEVNTSAQNE
jgi:hypothetical protein